MKIKAVNIYDIITLICGLSLVYISVIMVNAPLLRVLIIIAGVSLILYVIMSIYTFNKLNKLLLIRRLK